MSGTSVVGLQWGDEAKGKVVDLLTEQNDIVVRYQGGANAGHTVVTDGKKYKLSLIPSGIFNPKVQCVIASGVVIDPAFLITEIKTLRSQGVEIGKNLLISDRAHLIFPWHKEEDRLMDAIASKESIGTTMRGIGPCYRDKVGRSLAIRLGDMYRSDFKQRLSEVAKAKDHLLGMMTDTDWEPMDDEEIHTTYAEYAKELAEHVGDTTAFLLDAADANQRILFEAAQGSLLDIDHGTFPYVTSSNSSGVGVSSGSGVPGCHISKVVGIIKAYTTRVGGGPFPTELDNETGQKIRDRGNEYGTVTKRPRRCGWFDAVAVRYTARLSGVSKLSIMLLDVLSTFRELKICTAYSLNGKTIRDFPAHVDDLRQVTPVYETLPGWTEEISDVRSLDRLPQNARNYVRRLSELVGKPFGLISVGPDRVQTIDCGLME
ncbi:MAG: adenylosuccinate synthase [Planctomycetaceae bacterium]|nr:adenylosuccinate synthase [Planctomycetaceae bacterium]